jgi:peptide/nickel transport system ATP-binding protein
MPVEGDSMAVLLEVKNLKTQFNTESGLVRAVDGVSYHINEREIVGLVGESGCGKSVSQLSVMQLIPTPPGKIAGGEIIFEGKDLLQFSANGREMREVRGGRIAMIFQEPMTSLNPVFSIGDQIGEAMQLHLKLSAAQARKRSIELLRMVGIPAAESRLDDYPHQFSGGMRQRVMIAIAFSCNPKLLIADEPTTALDVTTQAVLLELMKDMVRDFNTSLVIVTHNLGVVARYADRICVMYAGRIVESGTTKDIFSHPRHPYTVYYDAYRAWMTREAESLFRLKVYRLTWSVCRQHVPSCPGVLMARIDVGMSRGRPLSRFANTMRSRVLSIWRKRTVFPVQNDTVLDVRNLKMYFPVTRGLTRQKVAEVKAVDNVSFKVHRGETVGLVGESGCGKTTTGRCILRLTKPTSGEVYFEGQDILKVSSEKMRLLRRKISIMFQDPYGSLDPRQSAGSIVGEPLLIHRMVKSRKEYDQRVEELFRIVGLDPNMAERVPHEFSGGQRQRIGIARALACEPSLIIWMSPYQLWMCLFRLR